MSQWLTLVARNVLRQRLRTSLTLVGLVVAILAFGVLQTVVKTWYAGVDGAVPSRLLTRNAISFALPLPQPYQKRISAVDGVRRVTYLNWFGGIYKDPKNFFPQFAIDVESFLDMHPEILVPDEARRALLHDRRGAIVGRKLAKRYGFKPGDLIQLRGTIFPGNWEFVISGVFDGRDPKTDTSQLLFRWDYLNETLRVRSRAQADQVGFFAVDVVSINRVAEVSQAIDAVFRNSRAETLTETERAFQIGFVKQTEAILISIRVVSFVVIFIILSVMANTMAMTARERLREYATLKALGFSPGYVARLILGESVMIALIGGALAIALTPLAAARLAELSATLFPALIVSVGTVLLQVLAALVVGVLAAVLPMRQAARVSIVNGLRALG
jgi:putative ABC transport system permease protein